MHLVLLVYLPPVYTQAAGPISSAISPHLESLLAANANALAAAKAHRHSELARLLYAEDASVPVKTLAGRLANHLDALDAVRLVWCFCARSLPGSIVLWVHALLTSVRLTHLFHSTLV